MQRLIQFIIRFLGIISPTLGGRFAYYIFFKPFRLTSHPLDLVKKEEGSRVDFVIAGKKTAAWFWGDGPVIVLVHGWSSKGLHYRKFIEPLVSAGFTVVIPDLPGHVESEGSSSSVLEFKANLKAIVEHFNGVYALMGHSLGAMASILFLADNEHTVEKLVVANSSIYGETIMNRFIEQIGGNEKIKTALLNRLSKNFNQDFSYYSTYYRFRDIENPPQMMVIGDERDPEVPVTELHALAERSNAELLITKGLGHNGGLKDEAVLEKVVDFLAKKNRDKPG